ncbi:MAG TPA: ParB N-terminal domain-containing protein [Gemmatimonadales bacterium]|jgi:ParB family chromosome partitioning protein
MPEPKSAKKPRRSKKKSQAEPRSRGLEADRLASGPVPQAVASLQEQIMKAGGSVLATYREPLGGNWQLLASLPIDSVEPTPFQRDLSETHVTRLASAIERLERYLDPLIVVPAEDGRYWTPNGNHRLAALRRLGAKAVIALVVPEMEVAHRILLLNTEKAHNVRERALEVSRLAAGLAELDDRPEREYETEFEEPALLTLGFCYQQNGRFAGGAYHPVLRRIDQFLSSRLSESLKVRQERAARLLELDEAVNEAVKALKDRGFESPYLKAFVVARINPLRFKRGATADFDETLEKMLTSARKFDSAKIRADQVAKASGAPEEQ